MLDKSFDFQKAEAELYPQWEKSGLFTANPQNDKPPFTIMMPPPNVTGSLHVGHALVMTLQDVIIRYQRMGVRMPYGCLALTMPQLRLKQL
jgi:valyl-tRNA synthetase